MADLLTGALNPELFQWQTACSALAPVREASADNAPINKWEYHRSTWGFTGVLVGSAFSQ